MGKFFTFADRFVTCRFFSDGDDAYKVTLTICDSTDKKITECAERFRKADNAKTVEDRQRAYRESLVNLLGEDHVDAILAKEEASDCFSIFQVFQYVVNEYKEAKVKKLTASAR